MTDEKIRCPHCPWCGEPPQIAISVYQAFCSSDDCPAFTWDMTKTAAHLLANAQEINLEQGPEEKR
jgi:hypothetical protein